MRLFSDKRYCRRVARSLAPGEWAVLSVISEQPTHGFAVAKALGPNGEIGRVWSLSRPLVYRALDYLVDAGLVEKGDEEPSVRGPRRTSVRTTAVGRRMVRRWLNEPVEHVRDVRSLLMLKLLFLERSGLDSKRLLDTQRDLLLPVEAALEQREQALSGFERTLVQWRLESTRAVLRFLASARDAAGARSSR
jgi:PadR family transcriptional regulator AphA